MSSFVHLHVHSDFSLLRSTLKVTTIASRAKELGMDSIALTDEGNLFGVPHFIKACRKQGIKPIIGCEFVMAQNGYTYRGSGEPRRSRNTLVLIAENEKGYQNLSQLSSEAYLNGFYYIPRIDKELLSRHAEGLICLTSSARGEIPSLLRVNQREEAKQKLIEYRNIFGKENLFLSLNDHQTTESSMVNKALIELSQEMDIPCVATNEAFYAERKDASIHNTLLHIGHNQKQETFLFPSHEFYLKDEESMQKAFADVPDAILNSRRIADRIQLELTPRRPELPRYQIPESYTSPEDYLQNLALTGLKKRYQKVDALLQERLHYELKIIIGMGFTGYFLIVWDLINFAHQQDIPVGPGRGSGAASLVAYCLRITNIDPIKYHLLFERFLNPERKSLPDFDIDFCIEGRGRLIEYVTQKYGEQQVGQIITFGTFNIRAAMKDSARTLGIPYAEVDAIVKLMPHYLSESLSEHVENNTSLKQALKKIPFHKQWITIAENLIGLHRHASTHAAGIVIGKEALHRYTPLYKDPKTGTITTQFSMDVLEDYGLIKMDLLGLKTLTIIRNSERMIQQKDSDFSMEKVPEHDKKTFEMLGRGESLAVFQLESSGMQRVLQRMKPDRIEDIIAVNALYRPGPMQFIDQFVLAKNDPSQRQYLLPELKDLLEETYGVIVYQEQVIQIVQHIGNFSLGEADIIRSAMGKKNTREMDICREKFITQAMDNGYKKEKAETLFTMLEPFAGYGFNKSHAAAYAMLAYHTAYLKAHYPAEFMAANLNCDYKFTDAFSFYLTQVRIMHIPIIPPRINTSVEKFTVKEGKILYGIIGIKHINHQIAKCIVEVRKKGEFTNVVDFLERVGTKIIHRDQLEVLVLSGFFDSLHKNRKLLYNNLNVLISLAEEHGYSQESGQTLLFDNHAEMAKILDEKQEDFPAIQKLSYELQYLSNYFSGHPLDLFKKSWQEAQRKNTSAVKEIVGVYRLSRLTYTRQKTEMIIAEVEDYQKMYKVTIFPERIAENQHLLKDDRVLRLKVRIDPRFGSHMVVQSLDIPPSDAELEIEELHLRIDSKENTTVTIKKLISLISSSRGTSQVIFHIPTDKGMVAIQASDQFRVRASGELIARLKENPDIGRVWHKRSSENHAPV